MVRDEARHRWVTTDEDETEVKEQKRLFVIDHVVYVQV